ncbi:hypothetical protein ACFLY9_02755 [Patescibacteria group bacterium]
MTELYDNPITPEEVPMIRGNGRNERWSRSGLVLSDLVDNGVEYFWKTFAVYYELSTDSQLDDITACRIIEKNVNKETRAYTLLTCFLIAKMHPVTIAKTMKMKYHALLRRLQFEIRTRFLPRIAIELNKEPIPVCEMKIPNIELKFSLPPSLSSS